MILEQARAILDTIGGRKYPGLICYWSRPRQHLMLHQRPCTVEEIIAEAELWVERRKQK